MKTLIKHLISFPDLITYQGVTFRFTIQHQKSYRVCIAYDILYCDDNSSHKKDIDEYGSWQNDILGTKEQECFCSFLWLSGGIDNEGDMWRNIKLLKKFLKDNKEKLNL